QKCESTAASSSRLNSRGSWPQPTGQSDSTFRNAGPCASAARFAFNDRSCQCVATPCATYGTWCAIAIAVMSLRCCIFPRPTEPDGDVVVEAPNGVAPERCTPVSMYASLS